jgi:hypothetical protein
MSWGRDVPLLLDVKKRTGVTPKALLTRPLISEAEHFFVACFYDLSDSRQLGEHPQRISIFDINAYLNILDYPIEHKHRFLKVIQALDTAYINHGIEKEVNTK